MVSDIGIFTSNKYECTFSTIENMDAPVTQTKDYTLTVIDDEGYSYIQLMTDSGDFKEDLKIPEDETLKDVADKFEKIIAEGKKECQITTFSSMGMEKLISVREGNNIWTLFYHHNKYPEKISLD